MTKTDTPPEVPDHELLRRVGRGSYGEVWLARNVMGSFRAVKVVRRDSFESDRPYEREFGGLQKFEPVSRTHPGLVSVLHVGRNTDAGYFYCVMEVADDTASGQTIDPAHYQPRTLAGEIARRGRLPAEECIALGAALAAALSHLHERGLVHRDIKPSNVIFVNGLPKFADIGLVTQIGTGATFIGTEGYLAPEGPGQPAADLYSLGKVLYEICMGKAPDEFPELPTRLRALPEAELLMGLNSVVLRACQPRASERFRSAKDLQSALEELRPAATGPARGNQAAGFGRPGAGFKVVVLSAGETAAELAVGRCLVERLTSEGFAVVSDERPVLSVGWARKLEQAVRAADAVVALLSPGSVRSELMAYALEVAHQAVQRPGGRPCLVPVCFQFPEPLPRQVVVALDGAAPVAVESEADMGRVAEQVVAAVSGEATPRTVGIEN